MRTCWAWWKWYVNISLDVETDDKVDESKSYPDVNSDKHDHGSQFENDLRWLYYLQVQHGWMCKTSKKYSSNAGLARGAFSVCPCVNTKHPTHVMNQNEKSARHQRLEKKLYKLENEKKHCKLQS